MKKKILLATNVVVALVLAYVFLSSVGLERVAEQFTEIRFEWLVLGAVLYAAMNLLNSFRIAWTLRLKWTLKLFFQHMTAMFVSDFTPGRTGYATMVQKLRVSGVRGGPATKSLGILFIADFLARAILAVAAVAYFGATVNSEAFMIAAVGLLVLGVGGWFLLANKNVILQRLLKAMPFFGKRLSEAYVGAIELKVDSSFLAANIGLSFAGAALRGASWTAAFFALGLGGIDVFFAAVFVSALVTVASFIPISLAGVGVQEGLGAYLFSGGLNIPITAAAAVMLTCRMIELSTDALLGFKELLTGWRKN